MADALAILPPSMGQARKPGNDPQQRRPDARRVLDPGGALLLRDPNEQECPYTFSDSPAYVLQKKLEKESFRTASLEGSRETRGFLRSIEDLGAKQQWEEALRSLERRTAVPSGLFLVTRAVLRWKFSRHALALEDAGEVVKAYGSSTQAGPLGAALECFLRICLGSEVRRSALERCSAELRPLIEAWQDSERRQAAGSSIDDGEQQRQEVVLPQVICEGMEARSGTLAGKSGANFRYVFLKNLRDDGAPLLVHLPASNVLAADFVSSELAARFRDLPVHLLVFDGSSSSSSSQQQRCPWEVEAIAERLGETLISLGLQWPYSGGLILSGQAWGAHLAVHLATLFPSHFPTLILDSASHVACTSGDRLGRARQQSEALDRWRVELASANLEVLRPLASDLHGLSDLEKLRGFRGSLLIVHGADDEAAPREASEGLLAEARAAARKELLLVDGLCSSVRDRGEEYWSALRRFCLKVQLETAPSSGHDLQHLCAICAEKATSKCGRCQKVWYCGRKHQAEHWKAHKLTCSGPAQPAAPVPEGAAVLAAAIAVEVESSAHMEALLNCLDSMLGQAPALSSVHLAWHASSQDLADRLRRALAQRQESAAAAVAETSRVELCCHESPEKRRRFEHYKLTLGSLGALPECAWVLLPEVLEAHEIWSPTRSSVIVQAARRAALDTRVLALSCRRRACPSAASGAGCAPAAAADDAPAAVGGVSGACAPAVQFAAAADVAAAMAAGAAALRDLEPRVGDLAIRLSTLQKFLSEERSQVLAHDLCDYRLLYKLSHSFGKKVLDVIAPDDEWMRWDSRGSELDEATFVEADDLEQRIGGELWNLVKEVPNGGLQSSRDAVKLVRSLRRDVQRRVLQSLGERLSAADVQALRSDCVREFLQRSGLAGVIGLQRWIGVVCAELLRLAAGELGADLPP
eukprot:TRINITY_DN45927_c0_g1_i1.p1 TRINITY_DN45927_c0_g1~~TRINITY_DN45927_c0_g1_i1.p1  ORF type:complete len:925 (-),score=205.33 TRINITY_DN45927_c0_g1_i1:11-2785(-)